jgi:aspartate/methionine/tyrosine aminotransferase
VAATAEPAILEARSWLAGYNGSLGSPIDLSQAAPPYAANNELLERISSAAADPETARYGPVRGELDLRVAYRDHLQEIYGGYYTPESVTITAGCNQAFFIAAMTLLRRGDAVLLPKPWYFNHKMTFDMLGIDVCPLECDRHAGYVPDADEAEASMGGRVRAVVLVTPNNPTGAEYPSELIERFHALCQRKGAWLLIDETYRDFRRRPGPTHAAAQQSWPEGVVGLYSFSKGYAVPGHRLGAIMAPPSLGPEILKVQDCVQICAGRAIQIAMTWGIENLASWRSARREDVFSASETLAKALRGTGWEIDGSGAYFAYVRHPYPDRPSADVAAELARQTGILTIPGTSFGPGQDAHVRLSFPSLTPDLGKEVRRRLMWFREALVSDRIEVD